MNQGQEMFYNFFIERTKEDKKEEAKALLEEGHGAFFIKTAMINGCKGR